jgi:hypothetical protein
MIPIALAVGQMLDLCVLPLAGSLAVSLPFWAPARFLGQRWPTPLHVLVRILATLPPALVGLGLIAVPAANLWADGLGSLRHNFPELAAMAGFAIAAEASAWLLWKSLRREAPAAA